MSDKRRVWHFMERWRRPRKRGDPKGRRVWDFTSSDTSTSPSSRLIRTDPDKSSILAMSPIMSAIILYMWRLAGRKTRVGTLIKGELCVSQVKLSPIFGWWFSEVNGTQTEGSERLGVEAASEMSMSCCM